MTVPVLHPPPASAPWLSILIPVFNVAPYLADCIQSIRRQWLPGVEVLLLDDGSTDGSGELMRMLSLAWPELKLFRHERNTGLSAARNSLLARARGDYLWFLDSDDMLAPGAIEALRALLTREPVDLVLCDFQQVTDAPPSPGAPPSPDAPTSRPPARGTPRRSTFHGPSGRVACPSRWIEGQFRSRHLYIWSRISRRVLWEAPTPLRFPEGRYFEDIPVSTVLALRAGSAWHEPAPWVLYRQRAGSIVSRTTARHATDFAEAMRDVRGPLLSARLDRRAQQAWMRFATRNFVGASRMTRRLLRNRSSNPNPGNDSITPAQARRLMRQHLAALEATLPIPVGHWLRHLWLRGHWVEAWRLFRWWRMCRR